MAVTPSNNGLAVDGGRLHCYILEFVNIRMEVELEQDNYESHKVSEGNCDEDKKDDAVLKSKAKAKKKKKKKTGEVVTGFYNNPFYTIKLSKNSGRMAVASQAIEKGTSILVEQPFSFAASDRTLCSACGHIGDHHTPATNEEECTVAYCSPSCLELRSPESVAIRQTIAEAASLFHCDVTLLTITYNVLCKTHDVESTAQCTGSTPLWVDLGGGAVAATPAGFLAQVDHLSKQPEDWKDALRAAMRYILDIHPILINSPIDERILSLALTIACRVNMNSYGIIKNLIDEPSRILGCGVFPLAAMSFNHSCAPNVINVFCNGRMVYKTLRHIQPMEELCVSYTDCSAGTPTRRQVLSATRYFHCMCTRCCGFDALLLSTCQEVQGGGLGEEGGRALALSDAMLGGVHCGSCGKSFHHDRLTCLHSFEGNDILVPCDG